ncbi:InlB B-repeat-containing protein [Robinsoniella peoriensis]|uniref:InlB B-repeat-containing protein n=1 Tax=Robinsoniella peoriensis TaxID=180332 RepID=UPI00159F15C2|nr:InlB B-repeat-containing protein [Robinsoniella peoriensis]
MEGEDGVPPEPEEIEGYTFAGWDRNILYTNVYRSQNIKATYYKGKYRTHKVEFVDYNGKALLNPQYIADGGSPVSPLKPVREGYTFLGWDKEFYRITAPVKIQALYMEGNYTTYPVSFYGKITGNLSWQLLKTEYVPVGEDAHAPELPLNSGYSFREWSGKITGIYSTQHIYAQYDKNQNPEKKYMVRFWRKGELIKTEEVPAGGNATAPTVAEIKGYSFVGWDKSYVNINSKERMDGIIDITAQFRLTNSMQSTMKLDQFLVELSALKLPLIVESGFSALGYAIVIPFDGNVLDIMAAFGLGLIIIANWDSVKGQWENLKAIFSDFAGQDAAGEILDNIEEGLDEDDTNGLYKEGKEALENADIDGFTIKDKHLSSSGGNWNKFNVATASVAREMVKDIIASGTIITITDNGLGTVGQQSYKIIIDAGKIIGTRGEHLLRIIVDSLGNVWTIFPE